MKRFFTPSRRVWAMLPLLSLLLIATVFWLTANPASAQPGLITGVVTDPDGNLPPPGTHVILVSPDGHEYGQAQVDPGTGQFSLGPVANGNYVLQARPPQTSPLTPSYPIPLNVTGSPVNVGTIALTHPSITGTVYEPDGTTPAQAIVKVFHHGWQIQSSVAPSGTYSLGGLITGTCRLQAFPLADEPFWQSPAQPITVTLGTSQTVDFTLTPANVAAIVTDPNGVPVANAIAHVRGLNHPTYHQDDTSPSGYFAIGDLSPDTYRLIVEPPWYAESLMASAIVTFTVPPAFTDLGTIELRAAPKLLTGQVETNNNLPVQQALVIANRLDHPGHQETTTNALGEYALHLSSGLWSVTVEPTPSSNPAHWLYPDPPKLVHFAHNILPEHKMLDFEVLVADSQVTGIITMPDGGTPPFTVTVSLRNNEGLGRTVTTEPDGSFSIRLPHGNYVLWIQPHDPGFSGPPPMNVHAPMNGVLNIGNQKLIAKDATISGAVLDSLGHGVGGVRVVGWTDDHLTAQTRTSLDGSYVLAVTPGDWLFRPEVPPDMPYIFAGEPLTATVTSGSHSTGNDFVLTDAPNQVQGQLVDENGMPVHAWGWSAAANQSGPVNGAPITGGTFTIYLPDGNYQVGVHLAPGSQWLPGQPQPVSVAGGEIVTLTVPLLAQNAHIVGALWDPREQVIPTGVNGQVWATNPFASVFDAINPANGTYHLGVSDGLWHLGYQVDPASGYVALDHHKIIPISAGQTLGVPLPVTERDSLLLGVVLDPDGLPLAGAVVAVNGIGDRLDQVTLRAVSNANGQFRLAVPYGSYHLWASHAHPDWLNPAQAMVVAPPDGVFSGLVLQFREPDATLTGTVSVASGGVSSGRVHIWAYTNDGAAATTTVELGQPYTLELLSGHRWFIGAALETSESFYATRTSLFLAGNDTLNLVLAGPFPKPGPVVVTFDSSQPQSISLADGTDIFIPAGAMPVSGTVTLHITPIATFPHQHHARLYKYGYAFIATDASGMPITANFNQNVFIRFSYDEAELAQLNLSEYRLKPAYFSTTTNTWTIPDSYVVDTENNQVVMQIDHFTDFALTSDGFSTVFLPFMNR